MIMRRLALVAGVATFPWMAGTLVLLRWLPWVGRRWLVLGVLCLPWLVWLGLAVPVLREVCHRPGGSCG